MQKYQKEYHMPQHVQNANMKMNNTLHMNALKLPHEMDEYKLTIMKCMWEDMRRFMHGCAEWEQMCASYIHYQYIDGGFLGFYERSCDVLGEFGQDELESWIDSLHKQHAMTRSAMVWFFERS